MTGRRGPAVSLPGRTIACAFSSSRAGLQTDTLSRVCALAAGHPASQETQ